MKPWNHPFAPAAGLLLSLAVSAVAHAAGGGALPGLLAGYRAEGAGEFSAARGGALWTATRPAPDGGADRSCRSCHPADMRQPGEHVRTGETIAPLSPAVNAERLADPAEVEKWLRRNCTWTLGRVCTPQEKGDLLTYIDSQEG